MKVYIDRSNYLVGYWHDATHHYAAPLPTVVIRWDRKQSSTPNPAEPEEHLDSFSPYGVGIAYPHCDSRILHQPASCNYCDCYPLWQQDRIRNRVEFTGNYPPRKGWKPCPADADRPPDAPGDHRRWGGNKPTIADGDPSWPYESAGSRMMYGDLGGRAEWPETNSPPNGVSRND